MNIYYILVTKHNDKTNTDGLTPNLKTRPKDLSSSYFLPNTSKKKKKKRIRPTQMLFSFAL